MQLEAVADRPIFHRHFVQPLEGDAATPELVANLRSCSERLTAVPVPEADAIHLVVGELFEHIANYAHLESGVRWNGSITCSVIDNEVIAGLVVCVRVSELNPTFEKRDSSSFFVGSQVRATCGPTV